MRAPLDRSLEIEREKLAACTTSARTRRRRWHDRWHDRSLNSPSTSWIRGSANGSYATAAPKATEPEKPMEQMTIPDTDRPMMTRTAWRRRLAAEKQVEQRVS